MPPTASPAIPATLTPLADQWTVLRERYAFLMEVLLRLMVDHPDLAPDVIQGAIQNVQDVQCKATAFNEALLALRGQMLIDRQEDSS